MSSPAESRRRGRISTRFLRAGARSLELSRSSRLDIRQTDQTSLTLNTSLIVVGFDTNGDPAGTVSTTTSLESSNNFINYCATLPDLPIHDGKQLPGGSCNPAPLGEMPSTNALPSLRIASIGGFNGAQQTTTIAANTTFPISINVNNLESGIFVNPTTNYLAAPQQLGSTGLVRGHVHVVIQEMVSLTSNIPLDPNTFAYFTIVTQTAVNGTLPVSVKQGLPEGFYRVSATPHAANYQQVISPEPQTGAFNDVAYIIVTATGEEGSKPNKRSITSYQSTRPARRSYPQRVQQQRDDDLQTSLQLDASLVATGFADNGIDNSIANVGQDASLTSTNNFINFCSTSKLALATGGQIRTGFCSPFPIGAIPAADLIPTSKFTYPRHGDVLPPNQPFMFGLAVADFGTGSFTDEETNYMSAPQQLDDAGRIKGHPFVIIEQLTAPNQATPTQPLIFTFFKGLQQVADSTGVLNASVTSGLPAGYYRMSSRLVATNSQPVVLPVLERGAVDDAVFFTVADTGTVTNATQVDEVPVFPTTTGSGTATSGTNTAPIPNPAITKAHTNIAAIAGAVVGVVVLLAILAGLVVFLLRRKRRVAEQRALDADELEEYRAMRGVVPFPREPSEVGARQKQERNTRIAVWRSEASNRHSMVSAAPSYHTNWNGSGGGGR